MLISNFVIQNLLVKVLPKPLNQFFSAATATTSPFRCGPTDVGILELGGFLLGFLLNLPCCSNAASGERSLHLAPLFKIGRRFFVCGGFFYGVGRAPLCGFGHVT